MSIKTTLAKLQMHSVQDILISCFASYFVFRVSSCPCLVLYAVLSSIWLLSICISCSKHYDKKVEKVKIRLRYNVNTTV